MAKVVICIEDHGDDKVSFYFVSDPHLPVDSDDLTAAQKLACVVVESAKKHLDLLFEHTGIMPGGAVS